MYFRALEASINCTLPIHAKLTLHAGIYQISDKLSLVL